MYCHMIGICVLNYRCVVPDLESLNAQDVQTYYYVIFDFVVQSHKEERNV